jgi:hypothetical protein
MNNVYTKVVYFYYSHHKCYDIAEIEEDISNSIKRLPIRCIKKRLSSEETQR